jgi:Family of unknown function (DUF6370)
MKHLLIILLCAISFAPNAQETTKPLKLDPNKKVIEVLASCGSCNFKMKVPGCPLAIKMDDKFYLVEGTKIDDHGDAHADDGFCNAIKKAKVQGTVEGDKFKVTYFEIIKEKSKD